jgi:hypothetical protein
MRKFRSSKSGCEAMFEDGISDTEIKMRLSWMGSDWKEVRA